MITNYQQIQSQFNRILSYSQDNLPSARSLKTDHIFSEWAQNKEWFFNAVGDLIYEVPEPITFELDADSKKQKVDEFIEWVGREYGDDMYSFFRDNYDGILENKLTQPYDHFPRGMKLSKVLMQEFGLDAEAVRQHLSMLIQSNKVSGKLCLSIHPLDYLSASENNHSWRSCHAMDGEYRVGNVSYMMDECTIIAYLKSVRGDVELPRFPSDIPWNDKKWRCYIYVDRTNHTVYAGRQYPFFAKEALNHISQIIYDFDYFWTQDEKKEILDFLNGHLWFRNDMTWEEYKKQECPKPIFHHWGIRGDTMINGEHYYFDNTKIVVGQGSDTKVVPLKRFIETDRDACCFNDLLQSHTYAPWVMRYEEPYGYMIEDVAHKMHVGRGVRCVCCGGDLVADSDTFICRSCRDDDEEPDDDRF